VCLNDGSGSFSCSDVSTNTNTSWAVALSHVPTVGVTVPAISRWGMITFIILAGLGAIYYMRRRSNESCQGR
jgi:cell division protein FtsW (lipid II flippase)